MSHTRACLRRSLFLAITLAAGSGILLSVPASRGGVATTTNVTSLTLGTSGGGTASQTVPGGGSPGFPISSTYELNYNGANDQIQSYSADAGMYVPLVYPGTITTTLVRVPGPYTNNNNIIYSRVNSTDDDDLTWNLNAPFVGDEQTVFNSNNINCGTDNLFGNTGDGNGNNNNIERLDVVFSDGVVATTSLAFAVFERGVTAGHDPFGIAAITAVDALGHPTAYGPLVKFGAGSPYGTYGATDLLPSTTDWLVSRNAVANQGSPATDPSASVTNQAIGGVTVAVVGDPSANALGVADGATIYGYSLFGGDVTGTGTQSLIDPTTFPLTTSSTTGAGGIDLIAYTGVLLNNISVSNPSLTLVKTGVFIPGTLETTITNDVFGTAHKFNALIFGDFTAVSGDCDNRLGVAGNLSLSSGYGVGTPVKGHPIPVATDGVIDRLIVGGDFADENFAVNGNIVVGGVRTGPPRYYANNNGFRTVSPVTIDDDGNVVDDGSGLTFATIQARMIARSATLGALPNRGVVRKDASLPYQADFVGNDPDFNVFNVSSTEWSRSSSSFNITAPAGSTVLINVHGPAVEITNCGMQLNGVDLEHVVYNYVDATSLRTTNFAHLGSVLAPNASAEFVAGSIDGRAVLGGPVHASNGFEFHNYYFKGVAILPVPAKPPTVHYTFTLGNNGDTPLTGIVVTDPKVTVNGSPISLNPGEGDSTTFTADYLPTAAELAAGTITNTASATGDVSGGGTVSASSTNVLAFPPVVPSSVTPAPLPGLKIKISGRATRSTKASRVTLAGTVSGAGTLQIVQGNATFRSTNTNAITVNPAGNRWTIRTGALSNGANTIKLLATSSGGDTARLTIRINKR